MKHHDMAYRYQRGNFSTDIELTNKCNLHCSFCPRDKMPATGFMQRETFYKIIDRIKESPIAYKAASCGTGDSILHPELKDFIAYSNSNDIPYRLTTSGTLLTHSKSAELLDAGLNEIHFSVTGIHETYTQIYGFPFEKTLENILGFRELSQQKRICDIKIIMVQTTEVLDNLESILLFWKNHGFERKNIYLLEEHNRSGSHTITTAFAATGFEEEKSISAKCAAPFFSVFIGWDGKYYLCSHDWKKKANFGDVFQYSFMDVYDQKMLYMAKSATLCKTCSYNPENYLADITSRIDHPPRQTYENFIASTRHNQALVEQLTSEIASYANDRKNPESQTPSTD